LDTVTETAGDLWGSPASDASDGLPTGLIDPDDAADAPTNNFDPEWALGNDRPEPVIVPQDDPSHLERWAHEHQRELARHRRTEAFGDVLSSVPVIGELMNGWGVVSGVARAMATDDPEVSARESENAKYSFLGLLPGIGQVMDYKAFLHDYSSADKIEQGANPEDVPTAQEDWVKKRMSVPTS
jgi:hypothetical protein